MSVLSDRDILRLVRTHRLIEPFEPRQVRQGVVSFGLSSYGYDLRLAPDFRLLNPTAGPLDPKSASADQWTPLQTPTLELQPGRTVLGRTLEYLRIPRHILALCFGKSTYARCGILVNTTPFEPEWEGFPTLAITNTSQVPVRLHSAEGIAQVVFLKARSVCRVSYADRRGKYQTQTDITHAKV